MEEIWKDIQGYEGLYMISNLGNVKSLTKYAGVNYRKEHILKPAINKHGYHRVLLSKDNKHSQKPIHRLVAIAFIPNPENKPEVNHVWGNKGDNRATSLEWNTTTENNNHALNTKLRIMPNGESCYNSKLTESQVKKIKELRGVYSQKEIAKTFNVSQTLISKIFLNRTWKHIC